MEYSGLTRIGNDRCQDLRWKGMYISADADPTQSKSGDRLFWCHRTHNCMGPDGKLVDDYECNETRHCYSEL